MGNKQSYNVAEANAKVENVKQTTSGGARDENVKSEVAFTYDKSATGINMKKSNADDEKYVQHEILYRIEPMPHMTFSPSTPEVNDKEAEITEES